MLSPRRIGTPGPARQGVFALGAMLAFIVSLGGCTILHALQPAPPLGATDPPQPPNLVFTLSDSTLLPARAWFPPAGAPWRGVILALHGYTDSRDAWELPAPALAGAGYAVFAPDQRGFGATATRGHWPGTKRLVADAAELSAQLRARYPGTRLVILGESMGGAVALILAARPVQMADAFILSAPAVWGWEQLAPPLALTLRLTAWLAPGWAPDPGRVGEDITASDNIPALLRFGHDPLTLRQPTIGSTLGLVDLMTDAQHAAPALHGRVLILAGRRDQIVPPAATHAAWAHLPPSVRRAFYPHGYHLLLRDTDRALVQADILAWLADPDAWLPSGADAAAAAWLSDQAWNRDAPTLVPAASFDNTGVHPIWPY